MFLKHKNSKQRGDDDMAMFPYEKYEEMTKEERTPVHAQKFNPEMHALDEPEANEPESNEPEANESEANQE